MLCYFWFLEKRTGSDKSWLTRRDINVSKWKLKTKWRKNLPLQFQGPGRGLYTASLTLTPNCSFLAFSTAECGQFPDRWSLKGRAHSGEATEQRQTRWAEDRLKSASYKEHAQILQLTPGAHSIITQRASHTFILTHPVQCARITNTNKTPILNNLEPPKKDDVNDDFHFHLPREVLYSSIVIGIAYITSNKILFISTSK